MLAGEKEAYAQLVDRYQAYVLAVVLPLVPTLADAEDVAQETFLRAYRSLHSFRGGSFKAWLGRIAINCAADLLRSRRRHQNAVALLSDEMAGGSGLVGPEGLDGQLTLADLIARLPPQQREVVRLYYFKNGLRKRLGQQLGAYAVAAGLTILLMVTGAFNHLAELPRTAALGELALGSGYSRPGGFSLHLPEA